MTAQRAYLSDFDLEYYHYEDNRHLYTCIAPNHALGTWRIGIKRGKRERTWRAETLAEAVEVRDREQANG